MGCCQSQTTTKEFEQEILRSKGIDAELKQSQTEFNQIFKILLLGTGESGKSTIFKQMQLLYAQGFSNEEKKTFRLVIRRNVIDSLLALISGLEKFSLRLSARAQDAVANIQAMDLSTTETWDDEIVENVHTLWFPDKKGHKERAVEEAYNKRSLLRIPDAAAYFLDAIDRISAADYVPTADDIIHARLRTTGIVEKEFLINESHFTFVDVGGQRTERRKWIHCFEGVTAIIFMTAISEYNQQSDEGKTSRLHESLQVFKETLDIKYLKETAFIIFFNKYDLFVDKIKSEPIEDFPEQGQSFSGDGTAAAAAEYIRKFFFDVGKTHKLYSHFTTATDTQNCERVFLDVKNYIHETNLNECGLIV